MISFEFIENLIRSLQDDENDLDQYGMDARTAKRLGVKKQAKEKKKPLPPLRTNLPFSLARVPRMGEDKMQLRFRSYMSEAREVVLKMSPVVSGLVKKEHGLAVSPNSYYLSLKIRNALFELEDKDLAKIFMVKDVSDAASLMIKRPAEALRRFQKNFPRVCKKISTMMADADVSHVISYYAMAQMIAPDQSDIIMKKLAAKMGSGEEQEEETGGEKKAYRLIGTRLSGMRATGKPIIFSSLSDITWEERGSRDGDIAVVDGVGGTRHHIDRESGKLYVLPGDTWYPKK